jgi:hypothetical protein
VWFQPVVDPNAWIVIGTATGIEPSTTGARFECHPNPFNPSTTLVLSLPGDESGSAKTAGSIGVYTPDGRLVRTLFTGTLGGGEKRLVWDGKDGQGADVTSGVYFAIARTDAGTFRTKLVLLR